MRNKRSKYNYQRCSVESLEARRLLSAASNWSLQDQLIGLDKATQDYPTITGKGETVVLIDSGGVDYNNPILGGGFGSGFKVVAGFNFEDGNSNILPSGNFPHATGSAGQVAANPHIVNGQLYQGVAPGVNLVVLLADTTSEAQSALNWIITNRTQFNIVAANYVDPMSGIDVSDLTSQLQTLRADNIFVAGAIGNYGPSEGYAVQDHLIYLVGSTDLDNQISSFTPRGSAVDMVAPGGNVDITWYANGQSEDTISSGTSWAGPQVVGAAALVRQVDPSATPDQILSILQHSATWIYDSVSNQSYPELNVDAALRLTYQEITPPAPAPTPPPAPAPTPTPPPVPTEPVVAAVAPKVSTPAPLTVSVADVSRTSVELSWPLDDAAGMKIILEQKTAGGHYRILKLSGGVSQSNSTTDTFTDSGLTAGITYDYRIELITSRGKRYEADATATTLPGRHLRHHFGHHHSQAA
jgi:hypothetical protein